MTSLHEHGSGEGVLTDDQALELMLSRAGAFDRQDEANDAEFYKRPRFTEHLDERARATVRELLGALIHERSPQVLDLMAAVSSHLPAEVSTSRLVGLGLNAEELQANDALDDRVIHDLNLKPELPFADNSFDIVLNTVSIQYVTHPDKLFLEVGRILKPGGLFVVIFSNRSFPTKAVRIWELLTDEERIRLVGRYFDQAGPYESPQSYVRIGDPRPVDDKYYSMGVPSDPVFAVFAEKHGGSPGRPRREVPVRRLTLPCAEELQARKSQISQSMLCPYCGEKLYEWKITDNPWSTWDHDLFACINDACPYVVLGWEEMYRQGNPGISYRFVYDKLKDCSLTIPVPNLNAIKDSIVEPE